MNGLPDIAERIPREVVSRETLGLPADSRFVLTFVDGSQRSEDDTLWSWISKDALVEYFGGKKQVRLCRFPVKRIQVFHEGLAVDLEVPSDCEVYQAIRSNLGISFTGKASNEIVGRVVGLVRGGEVIEERLLSGVGQEILGLRV